MSECDGTKHQIISLKIAAALLLYAQSGNLGNVLQAPCNVILSREHVVQPDIVFIERGRTGLISEKGLWGAPDIAIEIMSRNSREKDMRQKRDIYSRFKVKEYWMVDPDSERIEVLVWSELGYATAGIYGSPRRLCTPALPNLRLSLSEVFRS